MAIRRLPSLIDPEDVAPEPGALWSPTGDSGDYTYDPATYADPNATLDPYAPQQVPGPTPLPSPNPTDPPPDERDNPPPAPPPDPDPPIAPLPDPVTVTQPKQWWESATGLFEGPKNSWGMDTSQPDLAGFPQWDTATSLKYRFGREVAKYAPTADNAAKVIDSALAAGWDIRKDDHDPTMFWFNNPDGGWEAVRLLSGSNTWEFNWGSNATGGNTAGTHADTGPFVPPTTTPAPDHATPTTTSTTDPPWAPNQPSSYSNDTRDYTAPAPPTTTTTTPAATKTDETEIQRLMREALMQLLNQPEVNAESLQNDPAVRAQRIQAQRAEERQRAQLAEQNAYEGYADSGAEQTDLAGLRQQRSESEAAFIGQLAIQQMNARREDIRAGIQVATQQGQFVLAQQLSRELANLTAAIERERIAAQQKDNAEQRQVMREEIAARMGDNAASRALQERLSNNQLTQQDKQFLLSLGFSYDQLEINANADASAPFDS
jgi:hypothetical protein